MAGSPDLADALAYAFARMEEPGQIPRTRVLGSITAGLVDKLDI